MVHDERQRLERLAQTHLRNRFVEAPPCGQRQPVVIVRQPLGGLPPDRAVTRVLCSIPVAVQARPDHTQLGVCLRELAIDLERAQRRRLRLGNRSMPHDPSQLPSGQGSCQPTIDRRDGPGRGQCPTPREVADLAMLVMPGGQERTEEEYAKLLQKAGLNLTRVIATASAVCVLEAVSA
jgi:hypothetical protein